MVKGVLIDVDGTLGLSNDAHAEAWVKAFAQFGHSISFEQVRPLIGMGGDKIIPRLAPDLNSESGTGKDISNLRTKIFQKEYVASLQPAPGSRELVKRLLNHGLKLMIASSAKEEELDNLLKAAQVDDLLKEATTSGDADNSKPDPDIVHAALAKMGLPPEQVVMIGDTAYDIEAAGRAGVRLVAVRCGGWQDKDLDGAVAIYDDPTDILNNFEASLFA
ncbi:MAG: HAD family hydrolase [Patescibacteria group bacterium]